MCRMATNNDSANGTSKHSIEEIRDFYNQNKADIKRFANNEAIRTLRDITKTITTKSISTIDKASLKTYFENLGGNEKNIRKVSRYLYYRSNIYFRLVNWYAGMWNLRCRKVTPKYDLVKGADSTKVLKSFNETLDVLDKMNLQGNMTEVLTNVYIDDVCYNLVFLPPLKYFSTINLYYDTYQFT